MLLRIAWLVDHCLGVMQELVPWHNIDRNMQLFWSSETFAWTPPNGYNTCTSCSHVWNPPHTILLTSLSNYKSRHFNRSKQALRSAKPSFPSQITCRTHLFRPTNVWSDSLQRLGDLHIRLQNVFLMRSIVFSLSFSSILRWHEIHTMASSIQVPNVEMVTNMACSTMCDCANAHMLLACRDLCQRCSSNPNKLVHVIEQFLGMNSWWKMAIFSHSQQWQRRILCFTCATIPRHTISHLLCWSWNVARRTVHRATFHSNHNCRKMDICTLHENSDMQTCIAPELMQMGAAGYDVFGM